MTRRLSFLFPLLLAAVLLPAIPASAATYISRAGNTVTITGGDEVNYVEQVSLGDSGPLRYKDPAGISYDTGSCTVVDSITVECGNLGAGLVANVSLGGGDDTFRPDYILLTAPRLNVDLGAGADTTWGSALADTLAGGPGNDTITGMGGNDEIDGGEGNDRLTGSNGDDTITGGPGVDSLFGDGEFTSLSGYGNDTLKSRDGEIDALSCSFGADTAIADAADTFDVLGDCESRDVPAAQPGPAPGAGTPAAGGTGLTVALGVPKQLKLGAFVAGKALTFRVTFSAACATTIGLVVRKAEAKRLKIGKKDTAIARAVDQAPQGGTFAVSLKLKKAYRAKLRKARSVKATLVVICADASGAQPSAQRTVTLRR